jgi:hypothetical protein
MIELNNILLWCEAMIELNNILLWCEAMIELNNILLWCEAMMFDATHYLHAYFVFSATISKL